MAWCAFGLGQWPDSGRSRELVGVRRCPLGRQAEVLIAGDVVTGKYAGRPVAADTHGDVLRDAGTHHVPYRRATQVMEAQSLGAGRRDAAVVVADETWRDQPG